LLYAFFLLLFLLGSFLAGSRFSRREGLKLNRSDAKSPAIDAVEKVDPALDPSSLPPGTVNEKRSVVGLSDSKARNPTEAVTSLFQNSKLKQFLPPKGGRTVII
jgi:hypothetical protein